jgi:hypothetical protein
MVRGLRFAGLAGAVALAALILVGASSGNSSSDRGLTAARDGSVPPNPISQVDCNGLSPTFKAVKQGNSAYCTDPRSIEDGKPARFEDNGRYIGHDEPSVKFISSAPGSGYHMTYYQQLAKDPAAAPTVNGSVTHYAELSVAPWFGLPICDPRSYPQNPCTPDSDTNTGMGAPTDAGSAFLEVQFYAPGFQPFVDAPSCDDTRYCAALTIDSLSCTFGFAFCNGDCIEPVNFAYIQRNGVPAGPPSPQLSDFSTFTPNDETLFMNPGDSLKVTIGDTKDGLKIVIKDFTTGQSGFMVASAANGFMNTDATTCNGTPFSFHPEYNTARQENQVPWAALEGGVLMQTEIGHGESCSSVVNKLALPDGTPLLPFDTRTFQTCKGGNEGQRGGGEGPCNFFTGECQNVETQPGFTCPSNNFASGANCEFSDSPCMPKGSRPVDPAVTSGHESTVTWPVAFCTQNFTQNGDLDFDGLSYRPDWPAANDGSDGHPTPFRYAGPFDPSGHPYPQIQFETDVGASEISCDLNTGAGCTAKPAGAQFYPFWTTGRQDRPQGFPGTGHNHVCLWNFGNDITDATRDDFGKTAQYGTPNLARFPGTLTSQVMPNPQLNSSCSG